MAVEGRKSPWDEAFGPEPSSPWEAAFGIPEPEPEPEPQPEPEQPNWVSNVGRGMGERAAELGGNIAGFAETTGENLEDKWGLGGIVHRGGLDFDYLTPDEWQDYVDGGGEKILRNVQESLTNVDLGYETRTSWEDFKAAEGLLDSTAELAAFGLESGLISLPDMVGAVGNLPVYMVSRSEEIAQSRAENQGRDTPTPEDMAVGTGTSLVVSAIERFGADRVFGAFRESGNAVQRILKAAGTEAATEAIQEPVEAIGETYGTPTERDMTPEQYRAMLLERSAQGAAGGFFGGGTIAGANEVLQAGLQVADPVDDGFTPVPGGYRPDYPDPISPEVLSAEENADAIDRELAAGTGLRSGEDQELADLETGNKIIDIQGQKFKSFFHAEVARRKLAREIGEEAETLEPVVDFEGNWVLRSQEMADQTTLERMRAGEPEGVEVEEIEEIDIYDTPASTEGIEVEEVDTQELESPPPLPEVESEEIIEQIDIEAPKDPDKEVARVRAKMQKEKKANLKRIAKASGLVQAGEHGALVDRIATAREAIEKVGKQYRTELDVRVAVERGEIDKEDIYRFAEATKRGGQKIDRMGTQINTGKVVRWLNAHMPKGSAPTPMTDADWTKFILDQEKSKIGEFRHIGQPVIKNGIIDVEKTQAKLPPVPEGHTRLYRAWHPSLKFDDVFDAEKLTNFVTDKEGKRFTPDLEYADYFRASFGSGGRLGYIDVSTSQMEEFEGPGPAEAVVPVDETPETQEDDVFEIAKGLTGEPRMSIEELDAIADRNVPLERLEKEEKAYLDNLQEKIEREGIKRPINVIVKDGKPHRIWDGMHRLAVMHRLGMKDAPVRFTTQEQYETETMAQDEFLAKGLTEEEASNKSVGITADQLEKIGEITSDEVEAATEKPTSREPVEAAETFRTKHPEFGGLILSHKPGDERHGRKAAHYYGEIADTVGTDDMPLDVVLNKDFGEGLQRPSVFIANQADKDTGEFRQHKIMAGFGQPAEARQAFIDQFGVPPKSIHKVTPGDFDLWLKNADTKAEFKPVEWGRKLKEIRKQQRKEGLEAFREEEADKKSNWSEGAIRRMRRERAPNAEVDDLVTFLRKMGGLNMDNQSDIPRGRLKHLNQEVKIVGIPGIEQTGTDDRGNPKGLSLSQATEAAWDNGFIKNNDETEFVDIMYEAESGPIWSQQNHDYMRREQEAYEQEQRDQEQTEADQEQTEADREWADFVDSSAEYRTPEMSETMRLYRLAVDIDKELADDIIAKDIPETDVQAQLRELIDEPEPTETGARDRATEETEARGPDEEARQTAGEDLTIPQRDWNEILTHREWLWNVPGERVRYTTDKDYISPEEAAERLEEWKAEARNASGNTNKVVLSLFDYTGNWALPWLEAGYNVHTLDLEGNGVDIMDIDQDWLIDNGLDMVDVVLAACPCTDFASSGARWFAEKDAKGQTQASIDLVNQTLDIIEYLQPRFWVVENPVGRIGSLTGLPKEGEKAEPRLAFHPHNFGDPYTKQTLLWGNFDPNLPTANVEPTGGSYAHQLRGDDPNQKRARSDTFEGFAYAFFVANHRAINQPQWERYRDAAVRSYKDTTPEQEQTIRDAYTLGMHVALNKEQISSLPPLAKKAYQQGYNDRQEEWIVDDENLLEDDVIADMADRLLKETAPEPTPAEPEAPSGTIDQVLEATKQDQEGYTPLGDIEMSFKVGRRKVTQSAREWVDAMDDRLQKLNKLRGCAK